MDKKKYTLKVKLRSYENDLGEDKGIWLSVGSVMQNEHGAYILLDKHFNPAGINTGTDSVLVKMFKPFEDQNL
jgi:hypothetical protein